MGYRYDEPYDPHSFRIPRKAKAKMVSNPEFADKIIRRVQMTVSRCYDEEYGADTDELHDLKEQLALVSDQLYHYQKKFDETKTDHDSLQSRIDHIESLSREQALASRAKQDLIGKRKKLLSDNKFLSWARSVVNKIDTMDRVAVVSMVSAEYNVKMIFDEIKQVVIDATADRV